MEADTPTRQTTSLSALFRAGHAMLAGAGIDNAEQEAAWILDSVLGCTRLTLLLEGDRDVSLEQGGAAMVLLQRRADREPLQYILGTQEFCGWEFAVEPAVLIPRPETELLVEVVAQRCQALSSPIIADVGTGSGCIAISLAMALPGAVLFATDVSPAALQVAGRNASRHGVESRVTFLAGDLCQPLRVPGLAGQVAVVVSNPPYIPDGDMERLQPEVREFEPRLALAGGPDGLAVHRRLVAEAAQVLRPGGVLVLEVGDHQADHVTQLALGSRLYQHIWTKRDGSGVDRLVGLQRHV